MRFGARLAPGFGVSVGPVGCLLTSIIWIPYLAVLAIGFFIYVIYRLIELMVKAIIESSRKQESRMNEIKQQPPLELVNAVTRITNAYVQLDQVCKTIHDIHCREYTSGHSELCKAVRLLVLDRNYLAALLMHSDKESGKPVRHIPMIDVDSE